MNKKRERERKRENTIIKKGFKLVGSTIIQIASDTLSFGSSLFLLLLLEKILTGLHWRYFNIQTTRPDQTMLPKCGKRRELSLDQKTKVLMKTEEICQNQLLLQLTGTLFPFYKVNSPNYGCWCFNPASEPGPRMARANEMASWYANGIDYWKFIQLKGPISSLARSALLRLCPIPTSHSSWADYFQVEKSPDSRFSCVSFILRTSKPNKRRKISIQSRKLSR